MEGACLLYRLAPVATFPHFFISGLHVRTCHSYSFEGGGGGGGGGLSLI